MHSNAFQNNVYCSLVKMYLWKCIVPICYKVLVGALILSCLYLLFEMSVQLLFTVKIVRQYAMVYVLGTSTVVFSFLSGYVIIMAHLKDYLFTGVKPKCVQGRWLDTEVDTVYKAIVIREFFTNQKSVDICRANIPECIKERIIGRPICVACYDDIFVIQWISAEPIYQSVLRKGLLVVLFV